MVPYLVRWRWRRTLFGRQLALLPGSAVGEPLLPCGRVIGPLLHLDAPSRRLRIEESSFAPRARQATRNGPLRIVDEALRRGEHVPQPRRPVIRPGHHPPPIRAERGAPHPVVMPSEHADLLAAL